MAAEIIEALVEIQEIVRAVAAFVEITNSTLETKERADRLKEAHSEKKENNHQDDPNKLVKKAGSLLLTLASSLTIALVSARELVEIVAKSPLMEIAGAVPVMGTAAVMAAYTVNAGMGAWKIGKMLNHEMEIKAKDKNGEYIKNGNDFVYEKSKPSLYQLLFKSSDLKFENPKEQAEHKERVNKLLITAGIIGLLVVSVAFPPAGGVIGAVVTGIVAANAARTLYNNREFFIEKLKNIGDMIKDRLGSSDDATAKKGIIQRMGNFLGFESKKDYVAIPSNQNSMNSQFTTNNSATNSKSSEIKDITVNNRKASLQGHHSIDVVASEKNVSTPSEIAPSTIKKR